MAPLIPNGRYEIVNIQFPECVAELVGRRPFGPIYGTENKGAVGALWNIINIGSGGNQVVIESVASPGVFAYARQYQGAELVGSFDRMLWTVVKVDKGCYFQSPDANFVWQLPECSGRIVLVRHTARDDTKWMPLPIE